MGNKHYLKILFIIIFMSKYTYQYSESLQAPYEKAKLNLIQSYEEYLNNNNDYQISIKLNEIQKTPLLSVPVYFNLFNITCILIHNRIISLYTDSESFVLKPHSTLPKVESQAILVQAIEYGNSFLLYVAFDDGISNIYVYFNKAWVFIQMIFNKGSAADARLFYHRDQLYLFVANKLEQTYVTSILYIWNGENFDEIDQILTRGATSITFFENINSIILIITQNPYEHPQAGSIVLVLNNDGKLRKLQFLNTDAPKNILTYTLHDNRYVIIFNRNANVTIYRWNGNYLTPWLRIEHMHDYEQASMFYVDNKPVLFVAKRDSIILYDLAKNAKMVTFRYEEQYKDILDMEIVVLNNQTYLYLLVENENKQPEMVFFSVEIDEVDNTAEGNTLLQCISKLNKVLKQRTEILNNLKKLSKNILRKDKNMVYPGELVVNNNALLKNSTVKNKYSSNAYKEDVKPTRDQIKRLENQFNENSFFTNMVIAGNVYAENMNTSRISVEKINDYPWLPNRWLSLVNDQVITAPVTFNQLKIIDLIDENPTSIFCDFLFLNQKRQNIQGTYVINSLTAKSLTVTNINNIAFSNIKLKSDLAIVEGKKYFKTIKAHKILSTSSLSNKNKNLMLLCHKYPTNKWLEPGVYIEDLHFDVINGIHWKNFTKSLFRRDSDHAITGTLNMHSSFFVNNLTVQKLGGIDPSLYLTTSTDQIVASDLQLMQINVGNIEALKVNGISFKHDVLTINDKNIEGRINMKHVHVENNLTTTDASFKLLKNPKVPTLQMYDGIVKINGSLRVKSVYLNSGLNYDNKLSESKIISKYWSKSTNQVIPVNCTIFSVVNSNKLITDQINSINLDSYTMVTLENEESNFEFKNLVVQGNFKSKSRKECKMNLEKLDADSVKKHGIFKIKGHKVYQNGLIIDKLETNVLDNTMMESLVKPNGPNHFTEPQTFLQIIFKDDINLLKNKKIKGKMINTHYLSPLIQRTIFIHDTINIDHLSMNKIIGTNVNFNNSYGRNVEDLTTQVMDLYFLKKIKNLFVTGNMNINSMDLVQKMNGIDIDDYLRKVVFKNQNIKISGKINFTNNIFIESANLPSINKVDLKDLDEKYFSRTKQQIISESYFFDAIYSPHILTPKLNNIHVDNLINTASEEDVHIFSDLFLVSLNVSKSVDATYLNNEIIEITNVLKNPLNKFWQSITVMKNVEVKSNKGNLGNIVHNVVKPSDLEIKIQEDINFKYMSADTVELKKSKINNVDIKQIYDDALKSNDEVKIVTGHNTFRHIKTARLAAKKNANIKTINNINIQQFNNTFVDRDKVFSSFVRGHKLFNNLEIGNLQVPGKIHNVAPENIFSTKGVKLSLPNVHLANVEVNHLNVGFVNSFNISHMLKNRMVLNGKIPQYATKPIRFESITLLDKSKITTINNISLNEIVLDEGIQQINVPKRFTAPVKLLNNLNAKQINGYKPEEVYANALFKDKDVTLNNVIFKKPVELTKNINMFELNNLNKTYMLSLVNNNNFKLNNVQTFDIISEIETIFVLYLRKVSEKKFHPSEIQTVTIHIPLNNFGNLNTSKLLNMFRKQSSIHCGVNNHTDISKSQFFSLQRNRSVNEYKNTDLYHCVNYYKNNGEQNYINYNFSLNSNSNVKCLMSMYPDHNHASSGRIIPLNCETLMVYDENDIYHLKDILGINGEQSFTKYPIDSEVKK